MLGQLHKGISFHSFHLLCRTKGHADLCVRETDRENWFWFIHLYFFYHKNIAVRILGYK